MSETKFYSPVPKRKNIVFVPPSVIPSLPTPLEDNHLFHSTKVKRATSLLGGRDNILGYFYHRVHDWVFSKVTKTSLVKNGRKKKASSGKSTITESKIGREIRIITHIMEICISK